MIQMPTPHTPKLTDEEKQFRDRTGRSALFLWVFSATIKGISNAVAAHADWPLELLARPLNGSALVICFTAWLGLVYYAPSVIRKRHEERQSR
ncbi:MAG: hypothetical protein FWD15_04295 [Alphaproteobacteria bacterium]|nr:hypothetical protein [Alphaproteobacteria bacterium]